MLCREYPTRLVCNALGVSRATLLRKPTLIANHAGPRIAARRLTDGERDEVLCCCVARGLSTDRQVKSSQFYSTKVDIFARKARCIGYCV